MEHFLPERLHTSRPIASRRSSVNLADFLFRKDLADFLHEVLLDFLAYGFAHSVNNILSYLKTNFPIWMYYFKVKIFKCITWAPMKFFSLCGIKMKIFFHTIKWRHDIKEQNSHLYWRLFRFHLLCDKCVSTTGLIKFCLAGLPNLLLLNCKWQSMGFIGF